MPRPALQGGSGSQYSPLCPKTIWSSIGSLYDDELKPYGRILRKRISERATGCSGVDVDMRRLRAACEALDGVVVVSEGGGDWSALLRGREERFADVYSPEDPYTRELWSEAAAYFESLQDPEMTLPGGRYSCAQALIARDLPFLSGRSLGQVCHIVQLAISQKKLLGYLSGTVVPYSRSQSMVKERCAERQRPCTNAARGTTTMATWDVVRQCLKEILATAYSSRQSSVPLSNVKRLFRSRYRVELSETALGHAKLSELLQDPRLKDLCAVQLRGHGYVVVPLYQGSSPRSQKHGRKPAASSGGESSPNKADSSGLSGPSASPLLPDVPAEPSGPSQAEQQQRSPCRAHLPLSDVLFQDGCVESMILNTFIHAAPVCQAPEVGASRRAWSLPKDLGSGKDDWDKMLRASFRPVLGEQCRAFQDPAPSQCASPRTHGEDCQDAPVGLVEQVEYEPAQLPVMTAPSWAARRLGSRRSSLNVNVSDSSESEWWSASGFA
uniref:HTH OST-type domain-containing protein n=1 Tax=Noctiluca scintillans TaxID=2966 RepID=A0A7S0ZN17_NOCSC|mmetsp:Transcript_1181/g.3247  ORF Transcript_1181/g.3247 Transcript_1181/m.3247 type:complete len:497 (+) Transcript_1181:82-1572(+)